MEKLALFLEKHSMACFYKKYCGIECPGCGFQRSLAHLLRGEWSDSFHAYPALIPTILMLCFLGLHLIFRFPKGARVLLVMFFINLGIIIANYILKFIQ
ncbi:MAG: DUF2752 domain-containing protein [Bacteroidota bacterium]|nr:MAG: DUF2752 domain-containing protein [Bacteroidota bacterium]